VGISDFGIVMSNPKVSELGKCYKNHFVILVLFYKEQDRHIDKEREREMEKLKQKDKERQRRKQREERTQRTPSGHTESQCANYIIATNMP
jgi:hypothetical protein